MRELHVVELNLEDRQVVLSEQAGGPGTHTVPLRRVLAALRSARPAPGSEVADAAAWLEGVTAGRRDRAPLAVPRRGGLTPREIQARLRRGMTVAEVAEEGAVDPAWVERFASPVRAEQEAAVSRGSALVQSVPGRGSSSLPLGDSVRAHLLARDPDADPEEIDRGWSARLGDDGEWVLRYELVERGRPHRAEWALRAASGTITPLDRTAARLGHVGVDGTEQATAPQRAPEPQAAPAPDATAPPAQAPPPEQAAEPEATAPPELPAPPEEPVQPEATTPPEEPRAGGTPDEPAAAAPAPVEAAVEEPAPAPQRERPSRSRRSGTGSRQRVAASEAAEGVRADVPEPSAGVPESQAGHESRSEPSAAVPESQAGLEARPESPAAAPEPPAGDEARPEPSPAPRRSPRNVDQPALPGVDPDGPDQRPGAGS